MKANTKGKNDQKGVLPLSGFPKLSSQASSSTDKNLNHAPDQSVPKARPTITDQQIAESMAILDTKDLIRLTEAGKADDVKSILEQQLAMVEDLKRQKEASDAQNPWQTAGSSSSAKPSSPAVPDVPIVASPFADMTSGSSPVFDISYGKGKGAAPWAPDLTNNPRLKGAYYGERPKGPGHPARDHYGKGPYPDPQGKGKGNGPEGNQPPEDMSNQKCFNCNGLGHWSFQCLVPKTEYTRAIEAAKLRKRQESKSLKGKGKDEGKPKGKDEGKPKGKDLKGDGKSGKPGKDSEKSGGKKGSDHTSLHIKGDGKKGKDLVKGDAKGKDAGGKPAGPITVSPSPPRDPMYTY